MDYILYLLIFCMGTVFGSFFTLAVYRIPLRQDITHTRSYCPNCNHKLSFWDMIPILSYIFLGGKCRYCKKEIRIRYLLLEVLSGVVFVLFAISIKFNMFAILNGNIELITYFIMGLLYIATLFIIAGIDKENIKIEKPVMLFGFICVTIYIMYLWIVEHDPNIYRYVIYLALICILTISNTIYLRKKAKNSYPIDIVLLLLLMLTYTYEVVCIYTVSITLMTIGLHMLLEKMVTDKNKFVKKERKIGTKIPIGFYMCSLNLLLLITTNFIIFR